MRPGGVSPVRLCRMRVKRARTEATHWGEENPLPNQKWERLIYPVFEPFPYLELALVALAEIPEADAEGVFPLDLPQYDMMNEGTEHFEF